MFLECLLAGQRGRGRKRGSGIDAAVVYMASTTMTPGDKLFFILFGDAARANRSAGSTAGRTTAVTRVLVLLGKTQSLDSCRNGIGSTQSQEARCLGRKQGWRRESV
jgi:hypothetical protein